MTLVSIMLTAIIVLPTWPNKECSEISCFSQICPPDKKSYDLIFRRQCKIIEYDLDETHCEHLFSLNYSLPNTHPDFWTDYSIKVNKKSYTVNECFEDKERDIRICFAEICKKYNEKYASCESI